MSLVERLLPLRESSSHTSDTTNTLAVDKRESRIFSLHPSPYDQSILDEFYDMDNADTMAPSPKRVRSGENAPDLPQKSALRTSRLILDNHGLKLGGSIETTEPGQATPLDMYLSSEEDASSEADDFSDYGYDSSNEDVTSPTRRESHEVTARVVSVIYSGKPLIVDLTHRRRSMSPSSTSTGERSSILSSKSPIDRPPSSASSHFKSSVSIASRKSSLLSDIMSKKRPPFLSIDPYANGSTYSLDMPKNTTEHTESVTKPPKTPTQQILKGVSRTFSLVRKRSRPFLSSTLSPQPEVSPRDPFVVPTRQSFSLGAALSQENLSAISSNPAPPSTSVSEQQQPVTPSEQPKTPQTPVTYNDIVKAAKKNAIMSPPAEVTQQTASPDSPAKVGKKGILSGLAARRRSIKLTGKALGI
ncbi:hypothetical protein V8F20_004278 [Naviculisporaceae sp. PSN 640]